MSRTFLITRPNHDPSTNYLFYWSISVLNKAKNKKFKILDLKGKKANGKNFESYIKKHEPTLVFFNGHGSKDAITGYDNEVLVEADKNENLLSGRIVYARSCGAAKLLGLKCIQKGTICFIGYREKYFLGYSPSKITRPLNDEVAKLFLEPSNLVPISLIKENTAEDSYRRSQREMRRNLLFMLSSKASQPQRDAVPYLWANINNQVLLGDGRAKVKVD